jgi:sugar/nucleoside kinase (ribokinase family)
MVVADTFCGPMAALPAAGGLLLLEEMPVRAGGCAANVAIDLAKQGVDVDIVACVGQDSAANVLFETFKQSRVGHSKMSSVAGYPTSTTVILLIEGEDRRYLHAIGANQAFSIAHIDRDWLAECNVFYLGGLFALPGIDFRQLADLLAFCRTQNVRTVLDVVMPEGLRGMSELKPLLSLIDVFVPNEDEARAFTGVTDPYDQLNALEEAGANTVIITRGEQGSIATAKRHMWRSGAYQMNVVDPSGSGDAFTSGVIRGLLEGWEIPQILKYASAIGASATRATGTTDAVFSAAEADAFVKIHPLRVIEERRWT